MKRQNGFTMTELMVTIAIAAILLSLGVPAFKYITYSYRMASELNGFLGDMQYARGEALKEGNNVTVCASTNGSSCTGGTNWAGGWIVFSDLSANHVVGGNDRVLKLQRPFTGSTPDTFSDTINGINWVTFNREGFATSAVGFNSTTMTLTAANDSAKYYERCLVISPVGMMTSYTHAIAPLSCP